jgi:hypothetical protein
MLPGVRYRDLVAPTLVPIVLATGSAVVVRLALWGGHRSLLQALVELGLFAIVYGVLVVRRERSLLAELIGAVRRTPAEVAIPAGGPAAR